MAQDDHHQFQATSLCSSSSSNWWNNTTTSNTPSIAALDNYPLSFSCSTTDQLMTSFSWPNSSAATDVFDAKSARSCDESPGSVSNSSIALNEIAPYSSDPLLDFGLLSPTMNWSQPFLTSDQTTENNLFLQQNTMISEAGQAPDNLMGNSSLNQVSGYANSNNNIGVLPSEAQMMHGLLEPSYSKVQATTFHEPRNYSSNFHGRMDLQSQAVMSKVQQLVKSSAPKQQLQADNSTDFWNPLDYGTAVSSEMFHSMPNQLPQTDLSSRSTDNLSAKTYFGANNSSSISNKRIETEPALKKPRIQTPSPLPTFKVRKEKLGDRVTALQQLVSPFGKTDTASVLHEAIDYIKFLHDQVRTLSTPYLKNGQQMQQVKSFNKHKDYESKEKDLRSRGLCLVPVSSTYPVATETPMDFWNPTFGASYM